MYPHEVTKLRSAIAGSNGPAISVICRGRTEINHKGVALMRSMGVKQLIL